MGRDQGLQGDQEEEGESFSSPPQLPEAREGEGRLRRRGSRQARCHGDQAAAPQLPWGEKGLASTSARTVMPAGGGEGEGGSWGRCSVHPPIPHRRGRELGS